MKKKTLLVAGTNAEIVKDYVIHSQMYFKTMSTSACWQDIENHFGALNPDAFLIFPDNSDDDIVSYANKLKYDTCYNNCPVVVCANNDTCGVIQRERPFLTDLLLKRPVSADNLSLRILKYFEDIEKQRLRQEVKDANNAIREAAQREAEEGAATDGTITRRKHVLIVDDDRTILKMLKAALETNYEVTTMVNGVLVSKFLSSREVDLILLDYEMPVKTGAEVMSEIKSDQRFADIPVCFLTGVSEREKIIEILKLRPNAYMQKPVDIETLISTVSNLIDND